MVGAGIIGTESERNDVDRRIDPRRTSDKTYCFGLTRRSLVQWGTEVWGKSLLFDYRNLVGGQVTLDRGTPAVRDGVEGGRDRHNRSRHLCDGGALETWRETDLIKRNWRSETTLYWRTPGKELVGWTLTLEVGRARDKQGKEVKRRFMTSII